MTELMNFIRPELVILVPVLYFVGLALKKSQLKDKWIPALLGLCGVLLAVLYVAATSALGTYQEAAMAVFVALTQGILAAGLSVYVDQLFKQAGKAE